ncbi:MAG: BrnA antitoxin family protein [Methylococcales bacterium]
MIIPTTRRWTIVFSPGRRWIGHPLKKQLTLRLNEDVLDWLKKQGKGYQTKINAILLAYDEAHKNTNDARR